MMTQEDYPLSDIESLLSKGNITDNILLQLPDLLLEQPKTFLAKPLSFTNQKSYLSHQPINLQSPWTIEPKSKCQLSAQRSSFTNKENEEATLKNNFTKNPKFQFNLTYKIEENLNHWRHVFFGIPNNKNLPSKTHH